MPKNKLGKKSFTLLELVMVLVIIGFTGYITIPHIVQNIEAGAAKREVNRLIAWARWCQSQAITEHRPYRIVFDTTNDAYTIQKYLSGSFVDIETINMEPGADLSPGGSFPGDILEFDQLGYPVPPPTTNYYINIRNPEWTIIAFYVYDNGRMSCL